MNEQKYTKLEQNRLEKIDQLRELGIEPYPHRVERTHTSLEAIAALEAWEKQQGADPVSGYSGRDASARCARWASWLLPTLRMALAASSFSSA